MKSDKAFNAGRTLGVQQMLEVLFCSEHGEPYCACQAPLRDELLALAKATTTRPDDDSRAHR